MNPMYVLSHYPYTFQLADLKLFIIVHVLQLQSAVISALFALALIFGGIASVANARNLQHEYLDQYDCAAIDDDLPNDDNDIDFEIAQKLCHYLEKLRRCQIASAVS